jgi:hypothetical protein
MHRPASVLLWMLTLLVAASAAQQDMLQYMNRIPKCAVSLPSLRLPCTLETRFPDQKCVSPVQITCILQEVPKSACKTVTNTTCLCSDEPLREATQLCVRTTCESMLDALGTPFQAH